MKKLVMITSKFAGLGTGPGTLPPAPVEVGTGPDAFAPVSPGANEPVGAAPGLSATRIEVWDGFEVRFLRNALLEVAVVPELGGKIISLKNLGTGREWMYRPDTGVKLFRNQPGDDFAGSPLVGWDECLPTITPCHWRGDSLPDHGEVWSAAGRLDEAAWAEGMIKTLFVLPVSPFEFTRTINLQGDTLNVDYRLVNLGGEAREFLWIMHPLLALHEGDRLILSPEIRRHLSPPPWLDSLDFSDQTPAQAKVFAGPLQLGRAEIGNVISGDRLILAWEAADCPMLGIWLTRGGWHGHHHLALEPANGDHDSLAEAAARRQGCGRLPAGGEKKWRIQVRLPSAGAPS